MKQLSLDTRFRINYNTILLAILFFFMHNCFYLVDANSKLLGLIGYNDFLFAYCLFLFLFYYLKYPGNYFTGRFAKVIFFIPLLIILSSFMSAIHYHQGVFSGFMTQRAWLVTMFLYFPIMALIRNGKLNLEIFLSILYFVVFLELFLYFFQYLIGETHMFLHVLYNYRYGSIRLYTDTTYMSILLLFATAKFMKKEKVIKNIFFITAILSYILIVTKSRGASVFFLLTIFLLIFFSKAKIVYKLTVISIICLLSYSVFFQAEAIQEFIAIIFQDNTVVDPTYNVRILSQQFYLSKLSSTSGAWLFGFGYPNSNVPSSMEATGVYSGYLLADNGVYGFLFCYGLIGVIWLLYSSIVQLRHSLVLLLKHKDCIMIIKIILGLATLVTNIEFFYSYYSFASLITFILFELLFEKYKNDFHKQRS